MCSRISRYLKHTVSIATDTALWLATGYADSLSGTKTGWRVYMSKLIKIFLIISNFLLFCIKAVLFVLAGAYLVFYSLGGIGAITAPDVYRLGALLLPPLVNLVMLLFLFNGLKSSFIKVIFLFINGITAIHYAAELFGKIRLYMHLSSGSYLGNIDPGIKTMQIYILVFFTVLFTLNTLVMLGVIPIHKKDKEQPPAEGTDTKIATAATANMEVADDPKTQPML